MATTFNHDKKCLIEALGFDKRDVDSLNKKLANSSKYIIMEAPKHSELCQRIAEEFSYNELLFIATMFITDKTAAIIEQNPEVLAAIKLKAFLEQLRNEGEL